VIATEIDVLAEVLGRDCGLFFQPGNADQLAERLLTLQRDEPLRAALGEAARRRAEQRYSLDACAVHYAKCYSELLRAA
jgi:glycosyltransferase involved in cell wall biosynthesis